MKVPLLDLAEQNQTLRPEIEAALGRVLDTNGFILGAEVAALEKELADYCGTKHAIGCASGTDALLLALMAFDIRPATKSSPRRTVFSRPFPAVTRLGATPVFVDIDPKTYNLDVSQIEAQDHRTKRKRFSRFIFTGNAPIWTSFAKSAKNTTFRSSKTRRRRSARKKTERAPGAMSEIGCFSFYPSKNLGGMGDGGFMTTDDDAARA